MTPHTRKLMSLSDISSNTSSSPPPSSSSSFNGYKLNPPFDSSMALTALVLLSALFFMAIFSLYIRRFSDTNSHSLDLYRRRQGLTRAPKGVEPAVVMTLPVRAFHAPGKRVGVTNYECVICLSEFEESERVKVIPSCGHVFHVGCIDTWLECHVTCPICRTEEFFVAVDDVEERGSVVVRVQGESGGVEVVGPMGV